MKKLFPCRVNNETKYLVPIAFFDEDGRTSLATLMPHDSSDRHCKEVQSVSLFDRRFKRLYGGTWYLRYNAFGLSLQADNVFYYLYNLYRRIVHFLFK